MKEYDLPGYKHDKIGYYHELPTGEKSRIVEFGYDGWHVYNTASAAVREDSRRRAATMPDTVRLYNGAQYGQRDTAWDKAPALSKKPRGMSQTFFDTMYAKQAKKTGGNGK